MKTGVDTHDECGSHICNFVLIDDRGCHPFSMLFDSRCTLGSPDTGWPAPRGASDGGAARGVPVYPVAGGDGSRGDISSQLTAELVCLGRMVCSGGAGGGDMSELDNTIKA